MATCLAAFRHNITVVTVYATLGESGAKHGFHQTRSKVVVCDRKLLPIVERVLPDCPSVEKVILIGANDTPKETKFEVDPSPPFFGSRLLCQSSVSFSTATQVKRLEELIEMGKENPLEPTPPSPDDLAVIMYTSGTTGAPKGPTLPPLRPHTISHTHARAPTHRRHADTREHHRNGLCLPVALLPHVSG